MPVQKSKGHAVCWVDPSHGRLDKLPCYFAMKPTFQDVKSISSFFGSGLASDLPTIECARNDMSSCTFQLLFLPF